MRKAVGRRLRFLSSFQVLSPSFFTRSIYTYLNKLLGQLCITFWIFLILGGLFFVHHFGDTGATIIFCSIIFHEWFGQSERIVVHSENTTSLYNDRLYIFCLFVVHNKNRRLDLILKSIIRRIYSESAYLLNRYTT